MIKQIFVVLLFCTVGVYAAVTLTNNEPIYDHFNLYYLYDENDQFDIDEIEKKNFTDLIANQFSLGYRTGTGWFKIDITNQSNNEEFVLYFTEPFWTKFDLYSQQNGSWDIQHNALDTPLKERSIRNFNPAYKLHLTPGESKTYYIRGETLSGHIGEFKIMTQEAFYSPDRIDITDIYIIYTAILFIIIVFNIYNYVIIKDRVFAYYIAYIILFIVFIAMKSGFYLAFDIPEWSEGLHVSGALLVMFLVLFSGRFFELQKQMPSVDLIFKSSAALFFLFAILIQLNVPYSSLLFNLYSSLFFMLLLAVAIKFLLQGMFGAKFYLIALIIYMSSMGLMTLTFNGLLDNTDISRYAFIAGSFVEIIIFTLILSNKYHVINIQKMYRQKELLKETQNNQLYLERLIKEKTNDLMMTNHQLLNKTKELEVTKDQLMKDISERIIVENKFKMQTNILHHQAHYDSLTGLPNRLLFFNRLKKVIQTAEKEKRKLAIFFIDLDKFKEINDSLGHDVGDRVLNAVAKILRNSIRKEDMLARLAGDEFTIIIEEIEHMSDASSLAHDILNIFSEPIYVDDHALYMTCSIGISLYPKDTDNEKDLLKYADTAMYQAKESGRNNFQFYSPEMTQNALEQMSMKGSLRQAIDNNELLLYYQPQIDLSNNSIIGLEALVRWKHPTKGIITPKKFITFAEETGMITDIDRWVMHTAMKQLAQWYTQGFSPGKLALNVSMQQLENSDFITNIKNNIKQYGVKPEWLELEITEGHMMKNHIEIIETLNNISDLGISISIDDFGTGYSSLSLLKKLPIDRLKIDKSFINDLPDDEEDIVIVESIIALAKSLDLNLIAEGIETLEQVNFLKSKNCNYVQGHYYHHPLPVDDVTALLSDKRTQLH